MDVSIQKGKIANGLHDITSEILPIEEILNPNQCKVSLSVNWENLRFQDFVLYNNPRLAELQGMKKRSSSCSEGVIFPPLKALCKIKAEKLNANAMDENGIYPFFTYAEQALHTQSLRQPIGIIFTPSGRVYASSPPVITINKSGSRRFVLPEAFAACTSCLI